MAPDGAIRGFGARLGGHERRWSASSIICFTPMAGRRGGVLPAGPLRRRARSAARVAAGLIERVAAAARSAAAPGSTGRPRKTMPAPARSTTTSPASTALSDTTTCFEPPGCYGFSRAAPAPDEQVRASLQRFLRHRPLHILREPDIDRPSSLGTAGELLPCGSARRDGLGLDLPILPHRRCRRPSLPVDSDEMPLGIDCSESGEDRLLVDYI